MSYSTLCAVYRTKTRPIATYHNSHLAAPVLWDYLAQQYLGQKPYHWYTVMDDLCKLVHNPLVPYHLRVALAVTFDYSLVTVTDIPTVATQLMLTATDIDPRPNHWHTIAADMSKWALTADRRALGVGLSGTSVCDQRSGWTHRDLLRLGHVRPSTEDHNRLFGWVTGKQVGDDVVHALVDAFMAAQDPTTPKSRLVQLITDHRLPWETLPSDRLTDPTIWAALLPHMPLTAMIRNLGRMTAIDLLRPLSLASAMVGLEVDKATWLDGAYVDITPERFSDLLGLRGARSDLGVALAAALVRLALAHPERAHLALGEGWKAYTTRSGGTDEYSTSIEWQKDDEHDLLLIEIDTETGKVYVECACCPPPEFLPALTRAYRISAALAAIDEEVKP